MTSPTIQASVRSAEDDLSLDSLDYPSGFYHEQAPVHMNYIAAIHGWPKPDLSSPFRYCELGCGTGLTTSILAASNPAGEFVGIDLSRSHIEMAQSRAERGEVGNVRFIAADITEIDPAGFEPFDYVTLHGLYSWVPEAVRAAILTFIERALRPGGLVYVSYNAMPGYGSVSPIRRYFVDMAPQTEGSVGERARKITEQLQDMEKAGAPFFIENPLAKKVLSHLLDYGSSYVAHEYLASHWEALYFKDVAGRLAESGLTFVGSSRPVENHPTLAYVPAFVEMISAIEDPIARESVSDFVHNRFFRRDIFRKDDGTTAFSEAGFAGGDTLFAMNVAPPEFPRMAAVNYEKTDLSGPLFDRIKALLAADNLTFAELAADPGLAAYPAEEVDRVFALMTGDGFLGPAARRAQEPPDGPVERIRVMPPLNDEILKTYGWERHGVVLASPVVGNGVIINRFEALLISGLGREDPEAWIYDELRRRDVHIRPTQSEEVLESEEEERQAIRVVLRQFVEQKLPKLAYLGILGGEPA